MVKKLFDVRTTGLPCTIGGMFTTISTIYKLEDGTYIMSACTAESMGTDAREHEISYKEVKYLAKKYGKEDCLL